MAPSRVCPCSGLIGLLERPAARRRPRCRCRRAGRSRRRPRRRRRAGRPAGRAPRSRRGCACGRRRRLPRRVGGGAAAACDAARRRRRRGLDRTRHATRRSTDVSVTPSVRTRLPADPKRKLSLPERFLSVSVSSDERPARARGGAAAGRAAAGAGGSRRRCAGRRAGARSRARRDAWSGRPSLRGSIRWPCRKSSSTKRLKASNDSVAWSTSPRLGVGADDEAGDAQAVAARVDRRRRDVVVEAAPVVPRQHDRGRSPLRAAHDRVDEAGDVALAGGRRRGRVLAVRLVGHDPADVRQPAAAGGCEEVARVLDVLQLVVGADGRERRQRVPDLRRRQPLRARSAVVVAVGAVGLEAGVNVVAPADVRSVQQVREIGPGVVGALRSSRSSCALRGWWPSISPGWKPCSSSSPTHDIGSSCLLQRADQPETRKRCDGRLHEATDSNRWSVSVKSCAQRQ